MSREPYVRIEMLSQPRFLAGARAMVAAVAHRLGFSDQESGQIALALDEALCNVIKHGYDRSPEGLIWIVVSPLGDPPRGIRVTVEDEGRQVDPSVIRSRDLDEIRPGGLGVYIINHIMDRVQYEKRPTRGMCLTMEKDVSAAAVAPATGKTCDA